MDAAMPKPPPPAMTRFQSLLRAQRSACLYLLVAWSGLTSSPERAVAASAERIGVVDLQRALNETEDGRRAKGKLKKIFQSRQETLDKKQKELAKLKQQIEAQRKVLSRDALQKRLESYQQSFVQLQGTYVQFQKELAQKETELTRGIIDQMQAILRRIGQAEGLALILERNEAGVVWAPSHLDLTDRVIQSYNSGSWKKSSSKAKKGGAKPKGKKKK